MFWLHPHYYIPSRTPAPKDCSNSAGEALSACVTITMDDLHFESARKLPRSFSAVTNRDDPYGANLRRQAQDVLHLLIVERPDKAGSQTLVHHRKKDEHRGEAAVGNAEKVDAPLPVASCRPPGIRDDYYDQRSLGDEHLLKRSLRQVLFHPLVSYDDEFLRFGVPGRRVA